MAAVQCRRGGVGHVPPVLLLLFGLAFPLGWISPPSYEGISGLLRNPLTKLVLLGVFAVSLFHWAHRFRYTLYDGLQLEASKPADRGVLLRRGRAPARWSRHTCRSRAVGIVPDSPPAFEFGVQLRAW